MNRRNFLRLCFGAAAGMPCGWFVAGLLAACRCLTKGSETVPSAAPSIRQPSLARSVDGVTAAVPNATVVITNLTQLAVAIQYEVEGSEPPRVVAKGAGYPGERIRELAAEHAIPVVQKPDLACALYAAVDIGKAIPEDFYKAVADVLAYVYRITGRTVSA